MIIKKTARQYIHIELQNDVEKLLFILSKNTELLISFFHQHLENFSEHIRKKKIIRDKFSFKKIKPKSVLGFFVLIAFQFQYVIAQPLNALPINGKVVAGVATISQTSTATNATMTVNQTSQRAVINWDSFNVGKNAAVNFVTPGANSSTLNRVTGASPSLIQGALSSNGQIILVNANGITFGRGAQVDAPGVVASTMDIANKDFMDGKSTFSGSGSGKIVNKGTISATTQDGFIALLAPEVQNQGYLLASKGGTVVMAAGEQITLNFQGKHLGGVNVDIATYKALVANKRVVEVNGGLVVMAAGAANQLMSSVIKNTGRVSASSVVTNGGEIEFVGNTVTQAGTVEANSTTGVGGQVNLVGNNITATSKSKTTATGATGGGQVNMGLAQTAVSGGTQVNAVTPSANTAAINQAIVKANATQAAQNNSLAQTVTVEQGASIDASATQSGNGGIIAIWSALKTNIAGSLKAIGGAVSGNGGFVETSSKGTVILAPNAIINTSASNGKAGTWLLDPIDLTIDAATANIISAALENNNVSIAVNGNVCPSLGSCTQNGSGSLTIASGANILKATGSLSTLSLSSSGVFNLNANISGQNLNVIISSSIAYLNAGSSITANQVTVQAQTIYANGIINAQSGTTLGAAIQLLAQAIYVSGGLNTSTSSNTNTSNTTNTSVTYNGNIIRKEDLPTFLTSQNNPNGNIASGLDVVYTSSAANDSSASAQTNTNQTNIIHLNAVNDLTIYSSAQILANGTNGGQITLSAQQLNAQSGSLIQANGNNGPGGVIAISGNQFNLDGTIAANGNDGGLISINAGSGALSLTGTVQANGSNGRGGTVIATQASDIQVNSATIQANGKTDGGVITLIADTGSINFTSALIQTNGSNGRGGSIGISAQNNVTLSSTKVDAIGLNQGGTIKIGNDASNGTLPFALSASLDLYTSLNAAQQTTDFTNQNGGLIETSGATLNLLSSINAGRGGMWLLDPTSVTISATATSGSSLPSYTVSGAATTTSYVKDADIVSQINAGTSVTIIANGSITQSTNLSFAPASGVNVSLTYDTRTGTAQSITLTGTTTNTGAGNLTLNYLSSGQIIINGAINSTSTGKINVVAQSFYATNTLTTCSAGSCASIYNGSSGSITTKGGYVVMDATGGTLSGSTITAGAILNGPIYLNAGINTTTSGGVGSSAGGDFSVAGSNNLAIGTGSFEPNVSVLNIGGNASFQLKSNATANYGFVVASYATTSPITAYGNIDITSNGITSSGNGLIYISSALTSTTGNVTLNATSISATSTTNPGISSIAAGTITANAGTISINGTSNASSAVVLAGGLSAKSIAITGTATTATTIVSLGAMTIVAGGSNLTVTANNTAAGANTGITQSGTINDNASGSSISFISNNLISQTGALTLAANTSGTASTILYDTRSGNKLSTISAGTFTLTSGSTSGVNYSILAAGAALTVNTVGVNGVITVNNTYGCASSPCTALTAVDNYITTANFSTLATTAANGITVSGALTGGTGVYLHGVTYSANHGVYSTVAIAATTGNIDVMGITNTGSGIWAQNSSATFTASAGNIIMNGYQFAGNAATNLNGVVTATLGSVTITGSNTTGNYAFWDNALITAATGISITGTSAPGNGNATISMSGAMTVTGVGAPITLIATNTANPGVAAIADTGAITGASGTNITFISNGIITQNGAITLAANTSGTASTVTYDTTSGNKAANITGGNLTIAAGSTSDINYVVKSAGSGINPGSIGSATVALPGYVLLDNTYGAASGTPVSGYITNANSGTLTGAIAGVNVNSAITATKNITLMGTSQTGYYSVSMTAAIATSQGSIAITGSGINYSVYSSAAGTLNASTGSVTINGTSTTGQAAQIAGAITAQTGITINGAGTTASTIVTVGAMTLGSGYLAGTTANPSVISSAAGTSGSLMGILSGSVLPTISSAALSGTSVAGTIAATAAALQSSTATTATYLVAFSDGTYTKMVQVVLTASGGYVYATEVASKYNATQLGAGTAANVLGGTTNLLSLWNGSGAGGTGTVQTMSLATSASVAGYGASNLVLSGTGFTRNVASGNITITANNTAAGGNTGISQSGAIINNANGSNISFISNNLISQAGAITLVANTSGTASNITYDTTGGAATTTNSKLATVTTGALSIGANSTS
ncbi:filamentous hemagglutinin N-terminal domain-containing protein, partial [Polynucleobacter paneuropaeus]|nr:filamentous hemagglutinin N-terminal domain-containing protein [Polynucleobacter paneuropaeus]MBT8638547.1 filamentous hemagglutinin N-terminal domain-containing protein [Polynucleobacter paneuropaeus]